MESSKPFPTTRGFSLTAKPAGGPLAANPPTGAAPPAAAAPNPAADAPPAPSPPPTTTITTPFANGPTLPHIATTAPTKPAPTSTHANDDGDAAPDAPVSAPTPPLPPTTPSVPTPTSSFGGAPPPAAATPAPAAAATTGTTPSPSPSGAALSSSFASALALRAAHAGMQPTLQLPHPGSHQWLRLPTQPQAAGAAAQQVTSPSAEAGWKGLLEISRTSGASGVLGCRVAVRLSFSFFLLVL